MVIRNSYLLRVTQVYKQKMFKDCCSTCLTKFSSFSLLPVPSKERHSMKLRVVTVAAACLRFFLKVPVMQVVQTSVLTKMTPEGKRKKHVLCKQ